MNNKTDNTKLQDKLTGTLIGLARATEGNMHRVTESTHKAVMEGLCTIVSNVNLSSDVLLELIQRVEDEKKKLVPDCYYCVSPCGRNNDYDMQNLWIAGEESRSLRTLILYGLKGMAAYAFPAAVSGYTDRDVNGFFYKALYAVGRDDWGKEELLPIVMEAGEINLKCMALLDKANAET